MTPWLLLLSGLASPEWETREACRQALTLAGPHAEPALLLGLWSDDAELRRRVGELLRRLRQGRADEAAARLEAGLAAAGVRCWPWIDSLPADWPGRQELVWAAAAQDGGGPPEWPAYREVTREWARWRIGQGDDPAALRDVLLRMADHERRARP